MARIFSISNENKLVESKANFLSDWFHHYISFIGYNPKFELENPLSLVEKIVYQIENNSIEYLYPYLKNYFLHKYFVDDSYLIRFETYNPIKNKIATFKQLSKVSEFKNWYTQNNDILALFKALSNDLNENMFEFSLSDVIMFLKCSHSLEEHIQDFKFNIQIIISEYLFRDRNKDDLREVFGSLFSKNIDMFPFPRGIDSKDDREKFMKNRNLDEQFKGLSNYLIAESYSTIFYVKVYGVEFECGFEFKYDRVTFYSKDHHVFDEAKKGCVPFFNDNQKFFIASIRVSFFSQSVAIEKARNLIKGELVHICLGIKRNLIVDTTNNYLISRDNIKFFEAWSSDKFPREFPSDILDDLKDTPFVFLREHSNDAQKHLLSFEHIVLNAADQKSMPDFWHYLETLFQLGKDESKVEKIIELVSVIAVLKERRARDIVFFNTLNSTFGRFNFPYHLTDLTEEDLISFGRSLKNFKLPKELGKFEYPFVKEIIANYKLDNGSNYHKSSRRHYASVLREAYEQRNFYQHQAIANQKALIKLQYTLPYIVQRFRWALFDEIRKHQKITFPDVIDNLYRQGLKLVK